MDKKYRLLKDLPGIKAGVMVHGRTPYTFCPSGGGKCFTFGEDEMINNPDWFEEVKEEKPEKIKKGTRMSSVLGANFDVIYTGKGSHIVNDPHQRFKGVSVSNFTELGGKKYIVGEYREDWMLSAFKPEK